MMSARDDGNDARGRALVDEFLDGPMVDQAKASRKILRDGTSIEATLGLAESIHANTDRVIRSVIAITPTSQLPVCRRGCSACCFLHTTASIPEVIQIADHVSRTWTDEAVISLRERIDEHTRATEGMTMGLRRATRLRCPFLDDSGDCSIYSVRPNSCRGWNSRDVGICEYDFAHPEERVKANVHEWQWAIAGRILEGSAIGCHAERVDHRPLDMVMGVKIALDDPDPSDAWRSGREIFDEAVQTTRFPSAEDDRAAQRRDDLWKFVTQAPHWEED